MSQSTSRLGQHKDFYSVVDREEGELSDMDSAVVPMAPRGDIQYKIVELHAGQDRATFSKSVMNGNKMQNNAHSPPPGSQYGGKNKNRDVSYSGSSRNVKRSPHAFARIASPTLSGISVAQRSVTEKFIQAWHRNGLTYSQLVREGFDAHFLQTMYANLGLETKMKDTTVKPATVSLGIPRNPNLPPKPPSVEQHVSSLFLTQVDPPKDNTIILPPLAETLVNNLVVDGHKPAIVSELRRRSLKHKTTLLGATNVEARLVTSSGQNTASSRQDYIARLNAAKTKKFAGQVSTDVVIEQTQKLTTVQSAETNSTNNVSTPSAVETSTRVAAISDKTGRPQEEEGEKPPQEVIETDAKLAALQKRKAQTELARLRMQALIAAKAIHSSARASPSRISDVDDITRTSKLPAQQVPVLEQNLAKEIVKQTAPVPQMPLAAPIESSPASLPDVLMGSDLALKLSNMDNSHVLSTEFLPASSKDVAVSKLGTCRIPGLFMTSSEPLLSSDATIVTQVMADLSRSLPSTLSPKSPATRKRPVAADFDYDSTSHSQKRSFGRPRNIADYEEEGIVIQVSDEESWDSDGSQSVNDTQIVLPLSHISILTPQNATDQNMSIATTHDEASSLIARPSTNNDLKHDIGLVTPLLTEGELKVQENRILIMKKKIAELEQKRIAKVLTSGTTTPSTPLREERVGALIGFSAIGNHIPNYEGSQVAQLVDGIVSPPTTEELKVEVRKDIDTTTNSHNGNDQETMEVSSSSEAISIHNVETRNEVVSNSSGPGPDLTGKKARLAMLRQQMKDLEDSIHEEQEDQAANLKLSEISFNYVVSDVNSNSAGVSAPDSNLVVSGRVSTGLQRQVEVVSDDASPAELTTRPTELDTQEQISPMSSGSDGDAHTAVSTTSMSMSVDGASDADDSMSFDECTDENMTSMSMLNVPAPQSGGSNPALLVEAALPTLKVSEVDIQDTEEGTSIEAESESSYDPELEPVTSQNPKQQSLISHESDSSPGQKESIPDNQTANLEQISVTTPSSTSSSDNEEYEPPDANVISVPPDPADVNSSEDSDLDYEPPDASVSIKSPGTDLKTYNFAKPDIEQEALMPENKLIDSPVDVQKSNEADLSYDTSIVDSRIRKPATNYPEVFIPYESPLTLFKSYRYHPNFTNNVAGGIRSLTYSHQIDHNKELCAYEVAGGACNDPKCGAQHFKSLAIGDDEILKQIGSSNPGRTETEKQEYMNGLKIVIDGLRQQSVKDATAVAADLIAYRRRFLNDPTKILNL